MNERQLPAAFLRRCIQVEVAFPSAALLESVAKAHYPKMTDQTIKTIVKLLTDSEGKNSSNVSVAEFLDTLHACDSLKIDPSTDDWKWLKSLTVVKGGARRDLL